MKFNILFRFIFYSISIAATIFTTLILVRFSIAIYFYINYGKLHFGLIDIMYSTKAALAACIPLSIGIIVLEKIKSNNQ